MRVELKRLHLENGSTSIYVTHDQVEAMSLADRIVVMNEGILQQVGTPTDVYLHPANLFVAQFIGSPVMNIAPTTISEADGKAQVALDRESVRVAARTARHAREQEGRQRSVARHPPRGRCSSAAPTQPGYRPAEAHIVQPFGGFDIVDLRVGNRTMRARTTSGYRRQGGRHGVGPASIRRRRISSTTSSGASLDIRLGD